MLSIAVCVNFTYQRNGLNVDVTLSSDTISTRTITSEFFPSISHCAILAIILKVCKVSEITYKFAYERSDRDFTNVEIEKQSSRFYKSDFIVLQIYFTDLKALKFCVNVPNCMFSTACINILELNLLPT